MPPPNRHAAPPIEVPTIPGYFYSLVTNFFKTISPLFDIKTAYSGTPHTLETWPSAEKALIYVRFFLGFAYGWFLSLRAIPLHLAIMLSTFVIMNLPQMYFQRILHFKFEQDGEEEGGGSAMKGLVSGYGMFALMWIWGYTARVGESGLINADIVANVVNAAAGGSGSGEGASSDGLDDVGVNNVPVEDEF